MLLLLNSQTKADSLNLSNVETLKYVNTLLSLSETWNNMEPILAALFGGLSLYFVNVRTSVSEFYHITVTWPG